jgi:hypothetical protein
MPTTTLNARALNRATLARQMLLARERATPVRAIERLAGLQAQLPRPPYVGLWSRLAGFERDQLTRALARRQVVRATLMRGTLHLASARDYVALRATLQPMLTAGMNSILKRRNQGIDVAALVDAAQACFKQGPCTFERLRAELAKRFPKLDERAMGYTVRMQLPLVQVPSGGEWGFPAAAEFADAEAWLAKPIVKREAMLAHADRTRIVADEHRRRIATPNLRILPVFLADGTVAGTWETETKQRVATLTAEPFESLSKRVRDEIVAEGGWLLRFIEPEADTHRVRIA